MLVSHRLYFFGNVVDGQEGFLVSVNPNGGALILRMVSTILSVVRIGTFVGAVVKVSPTRINFCFPFIND